MCGEYVGGGNYLTGMTVAAIRIELMVMMNGSSFSSKSEVAQGVAHICAGHP